MDSRRSLEEGGARWESAARRTLLVSTWKLGAGVCDRRAARRGVEQAAYESGDGGGSRLVVKCGGVGLGVEDSGCVDLAVVVVRGSSSRQQAAAATNDAGCGEEL